MESVRVRFQQSVLLQHTTSGAVDRLSKSECPFELRLFDKVHFAGQTISSIQGLQLSGEEWERLEIIAEKAHSRLQCRLAEILRDRAEEP